MVSSGRNWQGRVSSLQMGWSEWFQWSQGPKSCPECLDLALALACVGQVDCGLECESLIKEVAGVRALDWLVCI